MPIYIPTRHIQIVHPQIHAQARKDSTIKIGIFGTGTVGRTLGAKLAKLGHHVLIGTRDVAGTMARSEPDMYGNPPFGVWSKQNPSVKLGTFAEAVAHGELLINATAGEASIAALKAAGVQNTIGRVLLDVANPLDFSQGMPPTLFVKDDDSLGEQIQRAFPNTRVVKALNTMNALLMTDPAPLSGGDHTVFVCGNDATAKTEVSEVLASFGWKDIIDLGDISSARGAEMLLPLWLRLMTALGTPKFNFKIVR